MHPLAQVLFLSCFFVGVGAQPSSGASRAFAHVKLAIDKTDNRTRLVEEANQILNFVKTQRMSSPLQDFAKELVQSVKKTADQMTEALQKLEQTRRAATHFTEGKYRVKPMHKLKAKKCTFKKVPLENVAAALKKGKISVDEPFIVTNASACCLSREGRAAWSALEISKRNSLKLQYLDPQQVKEIRVSGPTKKFEPKLISFQQWLSTCFVNKVPGTGTEHCEQMLGVNLWGRNGFKNKAGGDSAASGWDIIENLSKNLTTSIMGAKNVFQPIVEWRQRILGSPKSREALLSMISTIPGGGSRRQPDEEIYLAIMAQMEQAYFVTGPAGSGKHITIDEIFGKLDVLLFGSRRWFAVSPEEVERVAVRARESLEISSMFMFFEEKLPELREEFGLEKYYECNQEAGDAVWIPQGVMLPQHAKESLPPFIERSIWLPNSPAQVMTMALCHEPSEFSSLPDLPPHMQKWLADTVQSTQAQNQLIIEILNLMGFCAGAGQAAQEVQTLCTPKLWEKCRNKLLTLQATAKSEYPTRLKNFDITDFVPESMPGDTMSRQKEAKNEEL